MNRIDPRWIIVTGCALNAYAMYLMATLTLEASYWHIMLPRFIQGLGIGFTFVPLSTVALSAVPVRELGHASGLFNFIRTIGGSIGIAAVATMLERGSQVHQARLAAHVSLYDPDVWDRYQTLVGHVRRARGRPGHRRAAGVGAPLRDGAARGAGAVVHRQLLAPRVDLRGRHPVRAVPRPPAAHRRDARRRRAPAGDRGGLRALVGRPEKR